MDVILFYTANGFTYSRTIELLSIRGVDEPDHLRKVGVLHDYLNGGLGEQTIGFNKLITAQVRAITDELDRRFMVNWICSETKVLRYGNYISSVVSDEDLQSEWLYDCEHCREFTLELIDSHVYTQWDDGVLTDDLMYLKRDVEITGTVASPETLTTNSGKLVLMENGNAFPAFNSTTHDFFIAVNADKGCEASFGIVKASVTVSSGNLTWQMFVSDFGQAAADGKYYASIAVFLQAK